MPDPAVPRPATLLMRLERAGPARLLLLLLAFHAAVHARYLAMPPAGYHLWRQVDTLTVARNFHEEGMDLFRPRVDRRGGGDGVTGMEFPLLNYAIALVYRVAGVSHVAQRLPILILSCLAVAGIFRLARRLLGSLGLAFVAGAILVLSPLFTYYSIAAIPEIPVLALVCLGLAALAGARKNGRTAPAVTGIALLGLAALVKPPMVIPCAPAAAWLLAPVAWRARARGRIALALAVALAGAAVLGWYGYARALTARSGNEVFALQAAFPYPLAIAPAILGKNLFQWLPELYLNYGSFVWFVIGVIALLRSRADGRALPARGFVVAYAIGAALHLVLLLPALEYHDYYMAGALPLLVLIATLGFDRMASALGRSRAGRWALGGLVAAAVVLGPVRGLSRLEGKAPPEGLATIEPALERMIPRDAPVIAASDRSPQIFLYFMHRKGWSATEAVAAESFAAMIRDGARYLVSNSRALERRPEIAVHLRPVGAHGPFRVFRLEDPGGS